MAAANSAQQPDDADNKDDNRDIFPIAEDNESNNATVEVEKSVMGLPYIISAIRKDIISLIHTKLVSIAKELSAMATSDIVNRMRTIIALIAGEFPVDADMYIAALRSSSVSRIIVCIVIGVIELCYVEVQPSFLKMRAYRNNAVSKRGLCNDSHQLLNIVGMGSHLHQLCSQYDISYLLRSLSYALEYIYSINSLSRPLTDVCPRELPAAANFSSADSLPILAKESVVDQYRELNNDADKGDSNDAVGETVKYDAEWAVYIFLVVGLFLHVNQTSKSRKKTQKEDHDCCFEDCDSMHASPTQSLLDLKTEDPSPAEQNVEDRGSMCCSSKSGRRIIGDEDCDSHISLSDEDDNAVFNPEEKVCKSETSSKQENVDQLEHRLFSAGLRFDDIEVEFNDTSVKRFAIPDVPGSVDDFSDKQQKLVKGKENDLENRLNDAGFHISSTRCHGPDELEDILSQISSVRTPYLAPERRETTCYSVPRYPDNHNPLLPLALQNKLDEMSPREYLTYVLKDLTLEERESLMVDEKQRRKTFLVNWPHDSNLSGVKLAQAGFYSVDDYDRVQCVFCRGSLHKWEVDDNPMTEHARSFNFCRFVKGLECGNREYKNDLLSPEEFTNICLYRTPELKENSDGSVSTDSSSFGISTKKADMVQYAPEATRLKTFSRWPASSPITSKRLCDAGFYFTGFDDQVRCFYCSGGLREWKPIDDPFEEHARWFPDCSFLIQQKGEGYVNEVHAKTAPNKKCTRTTVSQKKAEKEQKQIMTNHQAMYEFCLKMGHDEQLIKVVIKRNNGPFENARDLVEAIYNMEDGDSERNTMEESGYYTMDLDSMPSLQADSKLMGIPEEDLGRIASDSLASDSFPPGMMDGASFRPAPDGSCKNCYRKTGQVVAATQIALPCGHVIYCSQCNAEEKSKVDALSTYRPKCMYKGCGAPMSGTFRVFVT